MDQSEQDETKEDKHEDRNKEDYWQNIVAKIQEGAKLGAREEPTLEPPILDFSLDKPEEDAKVTILAVKIFWYCDKFLAKNLQRLLTK
jgi:hypothetical protein